MIILNSTNLCSFSTHFPFPFYIYGVVYGTLRYLNQVMHFNHVEHTEHTKFASISRISAQSMLARLDNEQKIPLFYHLFVKKNSKSWFVKQKMFYKDMTLTRTEVGTF